MSVPIPSDVAQEVLAVANGNERYVFWTGEGAGETIAKTWANRYVRPVFEATGIPCEGHMRSHRLRDTFAVDLLQKGVPMEEVSKLLGHTSMKTTQSGLKGGKTAWTRLSWGRGQCPKASAHADC